MSVDTPPKLKRPQMTFPPAVGEQVVASYADASCIVEYGSGGSTVLAMEQGNKTILTVESDRAWLENLQLYVDTVHSTSQLIALYADIGPTAEWGSPTTHSKWRHFPDYAYKPWHHIRDTHLVPDLILIDGRFRVGCFLASMLSIKQKTKLLFDDYMDRPQYHYVEQFFKPVGYVERMAVFEIEPIESPIDLYESSKFLYSTA